MLRRRAALALAALTVAGTPVRADWQTVIQTQTDGSELAVMQGTAQYDFALFLLCKRDGEKHVLLQMGNARAPVADMKAASDMALAIKTDTGEHRSAAVWSDYGTGRDLLEYSNFYETNDIAAFIGRATDIVTLVYESPSLKLRDGAVAFADGAADAAKKFLDFCR